MDVLESVGLANPPSSVLEHCSGTELGPDGRLRFPRALINDAIAKAGRDFVLPARARERDVGVAGWKVHYGTSGAAAHIMEARTTAYREAGLRDIYDMARLVDRCDHIDFFFPTVVARDLADPFERDMNTLYAALQGTSKHVGVTFRRPESVTAALEMLREIAGGEKAWRARPFVSIAPGSLAPALTFTKNTCKILEVAVRGGMPVLLLAAGRTEPDSPASPAGVVVQQLAECLAALVYVNALSSGAPAVLGAWPLAAGPSAGPSFDRSAEQALLMSATVQMLQYYDLPSGAAGAVPTSRSFDFQAGYERACGQILVGNAGANLVYQSAGLHAAPLGCCYETLLLDDEAIGSALHTLRGIEVTEATLSSGPVAPVARGGPGSYEAQRRERSLAEDDAGQGSPSLRQARGQETALERAERKTREILAGHFPNPIAPEIDEKLRARLPIKLRREQMRPATTDRCR